MIAPSLIVGVCPAAKHYAVQLCQQMDRARISANPTRAACFLAQIDVESGGFKVVTENLNYRVESLLAVFGRHRISVEDAKKYGRCEEHPANPEAIANIVYGGAWGRDELGNIEPGDGWKFRGRGLKQLTGRDNYERFSQWWLGSDELERNPDLVAQPHGAVASAVWYWQDKGLSPYADAGDIVSVSRGVNLGNVRARGTPVLMDQRQASFDKFLRALR